MVAGTLLYSFVALWTAFLAPMPEPRPGPVAPLSHAATDSAAIRAGLVLSISEFQVAWLQAWQEVESARIKQQGLGLGNLQRWTLAHCHPDGDIDGALPPAKGMRDSVRKANTSNVMIQSRNSWFAVCPSWTLSPTEDVQDIAGGRDFALSESVRKRIVDLRFRLINKLAAAAGQNPKDGWITGQIIRFRLDARDFDGALSAAEFCGADPWWCQGLLGYVRMQRGERAAGIAAYAQMLARMTPAQRCKWDNLSAFIPESGQKAYAALSCDAQNAVNEKFWWLSDPLFRAAGNERAVDQQTRRIEVAIRSSLAQDEWHPWDERYGGDALQTLTMRYGPPSHYTWFGDTLDMSHSHQYLDVRGSVAVPPYTTFEYQPNRVHTTPEWSAALSPFTATEAAWTLTRHDSLSGALADDWWPVEHFLPLRPIVQFPGSQVALFRRQSQALVATAVQTKLSAIPAKSVFDVLMLSSQSSGRVDSLAQVAIRAPQTLAMRTPVAAAPTIISIEALGANGTNLDARTRFGVVPPPPLDSMKVGDLELSDIAFIDPKGDSVKISEPNEDLLDHMMGSVRLDSEHRRLGLYWESYGVAAGDSVKITLRIGNMVEVGTLQRIGIALRLSDDPNRSITQSWTEPDLNRGTRTLEGPIPVQLRAVALNLSQLLPGEYAVEISMQRPSGLTATTVRRFTIER